MILTICRMLWKHREKQLDLDGFRHLRKSSQKGVNKFRLECGLENYFNWINRK